MTSFMGPSAHCLVGAVDVMTYGERFKNKAAMMACMAKKITMRMRDMATTEEEEKKRRKANEADQIYRQRGADTNSHCNNGRWFDSQLPGARHVTLQSHTGLAWLQAGPFTRLELVWDEGPGSLMVSG